MTPNILLIDDDPVINFLNRKIVERTTENLAVTTYEDARQALLQLEQNPERHYLIFLDLNMPGMDGWDFLQSLCELPPPPNVDVVILTSSVDRTDEERALSFPLVRRFISKPLNKDLFKDICHRLIGKA